MSSRREAGSSVEWRVQYLADDQPDFIVRTIVSTSTKNRPRQPQAALWCPEMIEEPDLEMDFPAGNGWKHRRQ